MVNTKKQSKQSIVTILITIIIPSFILILFKDTHILAPACVLILALLFPLTFALYEWVSERRASFFAIFGFLNIMLTGSIGVFELPSEWIAIKESAIPAIIGLVLLGMAYANKPAILYLIEPLFDVNKIETALLSARSEQSAQTLFRHSSYMLSVAFLLSSVLNYYLATLLIKSPSGTPEFNKELGMLTALSYPVIAVPSMLVMGVSIGYLVYYIKKETKQPIASFIKEGLK